MGQHREAQEQVARAAGENGGRETAEVAVDRRELRILEVVSVRIKLRRAAEEAVVAHQHVVEPLVGPVAVAGLGEVRPWRAGCDRGRQRQAFLPGAQDHRQGHAAAGRAAEDRHAARVGHCERGLPHRHRIVHGRGVGVVGRHAVVERDHLEAAEGRHQRGLAGAGFARKEDVAAAVHVNEQAVLVDGRDHPRRQNEGLHAADHGRLDRHAELLAHALLHRGALAREPADEVLPFLRALGIGVPEVLCVRRGDHGLQFRAHRPRHRNAAAGHRARPRRGIGRALRRLEHVELGGGNAPPGGVLRQSGYGQCEGERDRDDAGKRYEFQFVFSVSKRWLIRAACYRLAGSMPLALMIATASGVLR